MAKNRNKKRQKKTEKTKSTYTQKIKSVFDQYWAEKSPIFRFILGFMICVVLFYLLYYSSWFEAKAKAPILAAQAVAAGALLELFGYSVHVVNEVISGTGASVKIAGGCDGLEATALFLSAILVFPLPFKYKWPGILAGFIILSILNVFRIAGLYLTQMHWPEAFDFMHIQGGLYLYSIITILLVLVWADWALKNYKKDKVQIKG